MSDTTGAADVDTKKPCSSEGQDAVLFANALTIFGTIMGTYYWISMLPALEADPEMRFTPTVTKRAQTVAVLAETVGTIFMSGFADKFSGISVLAFNGMFLCCMMVMEILSTSALNFVLCVSSAACVKGVMWPAICSVTAACMSRSRQDTSFLVSSFCSRLADTASPLMLGALLSAGLIWRQVATVLLVCAATFLTMGYSHYPAHLPEPGSKEEMSVKEFLGKLAQLSRSVDAWLVWFGTTFVNLIWVLVSFVPLLLTDLYSLSTGMAARSSAYMASGMTLGLAVNVLASNVMNVHSARVLQVVQGAIAVIALGALAVHPHMNLTATLLLLVLAGFGSVSLTYMPALIYSANSPSSDRGFNLGVMYGTTSIVGSGVTYLFGGWREEDISEGELATRMYASTCFGMLMACVCTACYYHKLQSEEECQSSRQELNAGSSL